MILKIESAVWRGNFSSMVNLLRVIHNAQHCAAIKVQINLLVFTFRESRIWNQSSLDLGFQFTLNISRTPLHINCARGHWKKNVIYMLNFTAKSTISFGQAMSGKNLLVGW
jgi:hypothetical protein